MEDYHPDVDYDSHVYRNGIGRYGLYVMRWNHLRAATANKTPRATPKRAANRTRASLGNRNVMVCAGTQKRGMVFWKTKCHCADQLSCVRIRAIGMGVSNARSEPPHARMCVSVIL